MHTTVWPDARIYSYASFDRERAHGLEVKVVLPGLARYGVSGYLNYAIGRVYFYNPITGGFTTEAAHLNETTRFLAPMDQTHTMTSGATYSHSATGLWAGTGSDTEAAPRWAMAGRTSTRLGRRPTRMPSRQSRWCEYPEHLTANVSVGIGLLRDGRQRPKLSLRLDVENITDNPYVIAREGEFSPAQFASPRLLSATAKLRF